MTTANENNQIRKETATASQEHTTETNTPTPTQV
jgi:hypothetical protein